MTTTTTPETAHSMHSRHPHPGEPCQCYHCSPHLPTGPRRTDRLHVGIDLGDRFATPIPGHHPDYMARVYLNGHHLVDVVEALASTDDEEGYVVRLRRPVHTCPCTLPSLTLVGARDADYPHDQRHFCYTIEHGFVVIHLPKIGEPHA